MMYLLAIGLTALAILLTYLDIRLHRSDKAVLGDTKKGTEEKASVLLSLIGALFSLLAAFLWCFGLGMIDTYGPYPSNGGYSLYNAAIGIYAASFIFIVFSLLTKLIKPLATFSNKNIVTIMAIIFVITLCLGFASCSNSCSSGNDYKDPDFAEKVLTPGTDENKFAHDWADENRKKNGVEGY